MNCEKEGFKGNEVLVIQQEQRKIQRKKIAAAVSAVLLLLFIIAIYDQWNEVFYEFGRNLYRWFNR